MTTLGPWTTTAEPTTTWADLAPTENLSDLRRRVIEARENMDAAWKAQSVVTIEEGYSREQIDAAIRQAENAQAIYDALYAEEEAQSLLVYAGAEEAEIDAEPLGGY